MTRKNPLRDRERLIFKTWVTPILEQAGFKKQGVTYVRRRERIVDLLDVQQWPRNTEDTSKFTLNCGICLPGVWKAFTGLDEPTLPPKMPRTLSTRPTMLRPDQRDVWWVLTSSDDSERDAEVGRELNTLITSATLPFFDRFRDERAVAEFLSEPRRKQDQHIFPFAEGYQRAYAAIIWNMLGYDDRCKRCLQQAIDLSRKTPAKEAVDAFAARFSCAQPGPSTPI